MTSKKIFFKLMNNAVFRKTSKNVRKHRDIKLVITDKKMTQLVSRPNYHTAKQQMVFRDFASDRNEENKNE